MTDEQVDEKQQLIEQLQRLQAEFNNYRSRVEREALQAKEQASEHLLHDIVPVVDNLALAVQHAKDNDGNINGEDLLAGLLMVHEQLKTALEHHGISNIDATGKPFDPTMHEAIAQITQEGVQKGHVIQTFQQGYLYNGKLLRPARVSVAR